VCSEIWPSTPGPGLWWSGEATFVLRRKSPGLGRLGRKSRGLGKEAVDFLGYGDERE